MALHIQSTHPVRSVTVTSVASLLAHQGGWDEVLLVAGPIVAIVGLLMLAKRRVDAAADRAADHGEDPEGDRRADVGPDGRGHADADPSSTGSPVRPERPA
jgi:hypothetical protein